MKMNRALIGVSSAMLVLTAAIATVHLVAHAKDNSPAVRVDSTPVNRDARTGNSYAPVIKKVAPSVVNISTARFIKERPNPFFRQFFGDQYQGDDRERTRRESSLGSGVIVTPDGYILTANHVVAEADEVKVSIPGNKKEFTARVIGKDQATDVAVLKISANDLPAVTLGNSDQLEVGDVALAIGNPFGLNQTVTMGIISALGRSGLPGFNQYQDFIQTDAAINPGNSGGALIDAQGRLIGINTAIYSTSGGNNGIGFAVPVNLARNVMERLINGGKITRGRIGVYPQDVNAGLAKHFNLPGQSGALIGYVEPNSPADKAGLTAGDVIVAVNGKDISGAENLKLTISQLQPGSQAALKFFRNGASRTVNVTLDALPDSGDNNGGPDDATDATKSDALDGVQVQDLEGQFRQQLRAPAEVVGAVVTDVDRASNSYDAGLRRGDVIVEVNHQTVSNAEDAVKICKAAKGDEILVKIWRRTDGNYAGTRFLSVDNTKRAK